MTMLDGTVVKYITSKELDDNKPISVASVMIPDKDEEGNELETSSLLHVLCNARAFDAER